MTQAQRALLPNAAVPTFHFDAHNIRIITDDGGNLWFVARDLLECLEYAKGTKVGTITAHIPEEWKGVNRIYTPGGEQQMLCLSEPGLYFFLGRSDKPKALPFQKWLAAEVLPSIRKTGGYSADPASQTRANSLAAAMAGMAYRFAHEAVTEGRELNFRLMLAFTCNTLDGKSLVPWGQVMVDDGVSALDRLTKTLLMPNGIYPTDTELATLLLACATRLNKRIANRAAR